MRNFVKQLLYSALLLACAASVGVLRAEESSLFSDYLLAGLDRTSSYSEEESPESSELNVDEYLFDSPAWALENSQNGIWGKLVSESAPSIDGISDSVSVVEDKETRIARVLRGQISPPVVSPSTEAQKYGPTTYSYDAAVNPPTTMDNPTTISRLFKYQQNVSGEVVYIPRATHGLGVLEGGARLFFAIPCESFRNGNVNGGVLALTPGFQYTGFYVQPGETIKNFNLPKSVFDASLTTSFATEINDFQGGVEVQVGVASEFKKITGDAFYVRGRAEGSLPVDSARTTRILGGVGYYGRIRYKLLPIAGIIWKPDQQNEFRLVFPDPMWGRFLSRVNDTDWWFYVHGDVGGGRWLASDLQNKVNGKTAYNFDYDDYRVGAGLRFDCPTGLRGDFEIGSAFGRQVRTKAGIMAKPKSSVYLKANLFF